MNALALATLRGITIAACLCTFGRAQALPNAHRDAQLSYLDEDAGIVLSIDIKQLVAAHKLALELLPGERQAFGLAGLGASALLGFYPFDEGAWTKSGFDVDTPFVVQVAAAGPKHRGMRTRIVLRVSNITVARKAIARMRLAEKARTRVPKDSLSPLFANLSRAPSDSIIRRELLAAGVFLVAKPRPLHGLLVAHERDGFIIIDIFDSAGATLESVLTTIERQPKKLTTGLPGADILRDGTISAWLRPSKIATTIAEFARGNRQRQQGCSEVAALGRSASVESLGLSLDLGATDVDITAKWDVRASVAIAQLLATESQRLLRGHGLLDLQFRLANWAGLRDRARPKQALSWDFLWAKSNACASGSKGYILAFAWPEVAGLFLSEVSALHPSSKSVIASLGAASASIGLQPDGKLHIATEAWVRASGTQFAKTWLRTLFGSQQVAGSKTLWGLGPMQPYAIDVKGGSIIGTGFRPGSRDAALHTERATLPTSLSLLSLVANPAQLAKNITGLPFADAWKPWQSARATIHAKGNKVELSFALSRSEIATSKESR